MPVELVITPRPKDLGGFTVKRALPYAKRRTVGPFIFWDEMGPGEFAPGQGVDVRPHPHIGLATVTYLFDGELTHSDTTGAVQSIRPGDVNWMTAGRGIVHSERTGAEPRAAGHRLHGIQSWVALPVEHEDDPPSFIHHPAATLPSPEPGLVVIAGTAFGAASPVSFPAPIFYVRADLEPGRSIALPDYPERAIYVVSGEVESDGGAHGPGDLAVFGEGDAEITAHDESRVMLFGGAPIGQRFIDWNFVSSEKAKIEQAAADWTASAAAGFRDTRFSLPAGETEHIPLPSLAP